MIMMRCGCVAQGKTKDGKPVCVTHSGIKDGAHEIETNLPNLDGRKAKCCHCGKVVESKLDLPYFEHHPNSKFDGYYSGCLGWS